MGLFSPLRDLADFVEEIERSGVEVTSVDLPDRLTRETGLSTEIELALSLGDATGDRDGLSLRTVDIESDGSLCLDFETMEPVVPSTQDDVEVVIRGTDVRPDGTITVTLSVSVSNDVVSESADDTESANTTDDPSTADVSDDLSATGTSSGRDDTDPSSGTEAEPKSGSTAADRDVPPFRNRELLAEVYESCETFAEMTEALDMDVTAETVRRYMIEHGIHEATTYDTTTDAESDTTADEPTAAEPAGQDAPVVLADGSGLVENIDVDTLIEVVRESRTIYEVTRELGVGREDAVDMLREYNLLDLIVGRLAEDGRTEVTRAEIVDRLQTGTPTR